MIRELLNQSSIIGVVSAVILLLVSSVFGFKGMPVEMGLSILAGSLGLVFSNLDKISEFKGGGYSLKMKEQIQAVIDKETEQDVLDVKEVDRKLSKVEESVLGALSHEKYTWRTLSGVAKDSGTSEPEAWATLTALVQNNLVRTGNKNKTGEMIWSLTRLGISYAKK